MDRHEHNGLVEDDLFSFAFRPMLVGHPPYLHTIDYPRARGACMGLPPFQQPLLSKKLACQLGPMIIVHWIINL